MKKILTLAAMLIGLSATAQIDSDDTSYYDSICPNLLYAEIIDSINTNGLIIDSANYTSWYYSGAFNALFTEPECTYYSVSNRIRFNGLHETDVIVNKYYGFEFVQQEHSLGCFKWIRGYIYHYGIPIYQFEIEGKLEVEIINQE